MYTKTSTGEKVDEFQDLKVNIVPYVIKKDISEDIAKPLIRLISQITMRADNLKVDEVGTQTVRPK